MLGMRLCVLHNLYFYNKLMEKIRAALEAAGCRVGVDDSPDKLGAKIRAATMAKVPYSVVVGPRDEAAGQISVRSRKDGDLGAMKLEAFIERLNEEKENHK